MSEQYIDSIMHGATIKVQLWRHITRRHVLWIFFMKLISIKLKKVTFSISQDVPCSGSHRPLTVQTRVRFRTSPWERSGRQSGTRSEFSPSTAASTSQYYSVNSPVHPLTHFSATDSTEPFQKASLNDIQYVKANISPETLRGRMQRCLIGTPYAYKHI